MMPRSIAAAALALLAATHPGFAAQNDTVVPTAAAPPDAARLATG
jgi:hypothetical protein